MRAKGAKRAMVAGAIIAELVLSDYVSLQSSRNGLTVSVSRRELSEACKCARSDMREG